MRDKANRPELGVLASEAARHVLQTLDDDGHDVGQFDVIVLVHDKRTRSNGLDGMGLASNMLPDELGTYVSMLKSAVLRGVEQLAHRRPQ